MLRGTHDLSLEAINWWNTPEPHIASMYNAGIYAESCLSLIGLGPQFSLFSGTTMILLNDYHR